MTHARAPGKRTPCKRAPCKTAKRLWDGASEPWSYVLAAALVAALSLATPFPAHAQEGSGAVIDQVTPTTDAAPEAKNASPPPAEQVARRASVSRTEFLRSLLDRDAPSLSRPTLSGEDYSTGTTVLRQRGRSNQAHVLQQGRGHVARVLQNGNRNDVRLTQTGASHEASIALNASDSDVGVLQRGEANRYELTASKDGIQHAQPYGRIQIGEGNVLLERGGTSTPLRLQQRGDGMTMIIRHD